MPGRRTAVAVVLAAVVSGGTVIADAAPLPEPERARLQDFFRPDDIERARAYRGPRYALGFGALAAGILALGVVALGPAGRRLGTWAESIAGGRWWGTALLLVGVLTVGLALLELPFDLARFFHDRRYELATQSAWGFLADLGKRVGFRLGVQALLALGFFAVVRALPRGWPAAAAGGAAALTVAFSFVFPLIYEPLFNRFTPVDQEVAARVRSIAQRAGVRVGDVLVADASRRTTRQNAYVSGLGATKRVVLYDTLLAKSSPSEVDLVVAHELAHEAHGDVAKGTALAAAGAVVAVLAIWGLTSVSALQQRGGFTGPGDPRAIPLLALLLAVGGLLAAPALNAVSRRIEASADRAALDYTRDPRTAIAVEVSLARDNLADLEPNPFIEWAFFTHPAPLDRIRTALDWARRHPDAVPVDASARGR